MPTSSILLFQNHSQLCHSLICWLGETWGRMTKLMGGPEGEFPAPWFANRGLVSLSLPCNRGSGLWSLPSPPVCLSTFTVKAGHWEGGSGASVWLKEEAETPHLWLFCRTVSINIWDCGRDVFKNHLKSPKSFIHLWALNHGDAKVVHKVENEKVAYGFHCNRIHHFIPGSTGCQCHSR